MRFEGNHENMACNHQKDWYNQHTYWEYDENNGNILRYLVTQYMLQGDESKPIVPDLNVLDI